MLSCGQIHGGWKFFELKLIDQSVYCALIMVQVHVKGSSRFYRGWSQATWSCCYCCSVPSLNTEGHPVCAPTPVIAQVQVQSKTWEDCVCDRFQWHHHVGSRTPSSDDFISLFQRMGFVMSGTYDNHNTTRNNHFLLYCSLSVLANINKWW